ncbi:MAG: response regulator [Leptolyngbya sp. SIO1E4]|nr:response regulator [Leptolyngbya sp. SIO1E4]
MTRYRYRSPQEIHLLSVLAQTVSRQASGCLSVTDETHTWTLYLERGQLIYASNSLDPFGRLDHHLRRLSAQIPALASPVRVQVRLLFEKSMAEDIGRCWDYEAICWLVEQQYLTPQQAADLIEALAKEVLETLLPLHRGNYDLLAKGLLAQLPRFCQLDLRVLVEACHVHRLRQQASNSGKRTVKAPVPPSPPLRNPSVQAKPAPLQNPAAQPQSPPLQNIVVQPDKPGIRRWSPPAAPASMTPVTPVTPPPALRSPGTLSKPTYTVACIDDSPTVLQAIEAFLDDKAFKVLQIENPVSALMKIIRNKPDLILLDVTMPNLDGYELCSLLRRHPSFKQTPIIMVTGNTSLINRAKAKIVGASGYLTKPFTQPDLLKIVFKHLK